MKAVTALEQAHALAEQLARRSGDGALVMFDRSGPPGDAPDGGGSERIGHVVVVSRGAVDAYAPEGFVAEHRGESGGDTIVVCRRRGDAPIEPAPDDFRVLAVMPAFNEEDIVAASAATLLEDGVDVHLIDHWSTDGTLERAQATTGRGRLSWERFPPDGPARTYSWAALLARVDAVTAATDAQWCLYHPVDELRRSPWPGVGLRQGVHHVDRLGFNAVEHTVLHFRLVDPGIPAGASPEAHFRHFSFESFPEACPHITAWRNEHQPVRLADLAGHEAIFPGRRLFPYNFLVKHFPVRSQGQAEQKLRYRAARADPAERRRGWPVRADHVHADGGFRWDPATLAQHDESFSHKYLIERLTGGLGVECRDGLGRG